MGIVNRVKGFFSRSPTELEKTEAVNQTQLETYLEGIGWNMGSNDKPLSDTIYFICLKHLSESLSKMPWELKRETSTGKERVYNGDLLRVLNLRPNPYMTAKSFWNSVELNRLHLGNAYIYIEMGNNGRLKHLWLLPSQEVQVYEDLNGYIGKKGAIWYVWNSKNGRHTLSSEEILHLKTSTSFNGIQGVAVKDILKMQIANSKKALEILSNLYKTNMFGDKILLNYGEELENTTAKKIGKVLEEAAQTTTSGRVLTVPAGFNAKVLQMKLTDAQFIENNKLSALQVAAAFGIKPNIINDYTNSSYSNSESQQVDFYVNTLQPIFTEYEQEITYKLLTKLEQAEGLRLEIDEKSLFRMDNSSRAEVFGKYLTNFAMTPNEVRRELGLPALEGGDKLIGNGGSVSIDGLEGIKGD